MLETSPDLCSARPRPGEPNATFGCTEASAPAWPHFHVHSIHASVGPSPAEATTATWRYQSNQQYSITAVTSSSGNVAERYAYTAYGQPTILDGSGSVLSSSAINNHYTHTGREWDQTLGLYHFRARWMSGLSGRFMGRDPIGYKDGLSLYRVYFELIATDPEGLCVEDCRKIYDGMIAQIDAIYEQQLIEIEEEVRSLVEFWSIQIHQRYQQALAAADRVRNLGLAFCQTIDRATYWGPFQYASCIFNVEALYARATGDAAVAFANATAVIGSSAAAYEAGRISGLHLWMVTAKAGAWDAFKECEGRRYPTVNK
ncbi:RHS repeat domain-containing protein [Pirellulaceae bacterium SH467]